MMKRRDFLGGATALLGASAVGGTGARAESVIDRILKNPGHGSWNDQFDAQKSGAALNTSKSPIFSDQTPLYIERAIGEYRQIVSSGGWPVVPANQKLELGATSRNVPLLRQRLAVSGDLDRAAGNSEVYDTWVTAAVKRFQARHGLPADGVLGRFTYAAMNIPASTRLGQLETNLVRLRSMSGFLGQRYVMVNIPAAHIEAVENGEVVSRHTAIGDWRSTLPTSAVWRGATSPFSTASMWAAGMLTIT